MSFFEHLTSQDAPKPEEAEVRLDLAGMDRQDALHTLDHTVKHCKRAGVASLYVSFPPAQPGEGETLFQPVARYFKIEKFNGYVANAMPLMSKDTAGLFVRFNI